MSTKVRLFSQIKIIINIHIIICLVASTTAFATDCRVNMATATSDAKELFAQARVAAKQNGDSVMNLFIGAYADQVRVREHRMGSEAGPGHTVNGVKFKESQYREVIAMQKALPDFRQIIVCLGISDDTVEVLRVWDGTLADKTELTLPVFYRFSMRSGKIVAVEAQVPDAPETLAVIRKFYEAGGVLPATGQRSK